MHTIPLPRLLVAPVLALALSSCVPGLFAPRSYNLTVDNRGCRTNATVFLDGQNVGVIPAGGVRSFPVAPGSHSLNVDNDLPGDQIVRVDGDLTWRGGRCL